MHIWPTNFWFCSMHAPCIYIYWPNTAHMCMWLHTRKQNIKIWSTLPRFDHLCTKVHPHLSRYIINPDQNMKNVFTAEYIQMAFGKAYESLWLIAQTEMEHTLHCLAFCSVSLLAESSGCYCFTNPHYRVIRMTSPLPIQLIWISEGLQ
jgi:hypothetical protein